MAKCPECGEDGRCIYRSPSNPERDEFVCAGGHKYLRYDSLEKKERPT